MSRRASKRCSLLVRKGATLPWLVLCLPVVLLLLFFAVHICSLRHRQLELEIAVEAGAHAGAIALADDLLLTNEASRLETVMARSRGASRQMARWNRLRGEPLELKANARNAADGELVLGTLENPFTRTFDNTLSLPIDRQGPQVNAVRVAVQRHGVAASATAFLDRDVIGFKIQGTQHVTGSDTPSIPVMPLAVRTKACPPWQNNPECWDDVGCADTWEYRILARRGLKGDGSDYWRLDAATGQPQPGSDGIPEMRVLISSTGNGQLLAIGVESPAETASQVVTGLTYQQLAARGGQLLLNDGLNLDPPRNLALLPCLPPTATDLAALRQALIQVAGQRRVWMVYSHVQMDRSGPLVVVPGFVAARVMAVSQERESQEGSAPQLSVIIQPTMFLTATAVTLDRVDHEQSSSRRSWGPRTLDNPYVARVRLVE